MSGLIIVALIVALVTFSTLFLRVPAALIFFSLLVGQLLVSHVSDDIFYALGGMLGVGSGQLIKPVLLLLPVVLSLVFLRGTISKRKLFVELTPAVLTGVSAALLLVPLIPALTKLLLDAAPWQNVVMYKSLIFFTASLASLITCWITFSKHHKA